MRTQQINLLALFFSVFCLANAAELPVWRFGEGKTSAPWTEAKRLTAKDTVDGLLLEVQDWDSNLVASGLDLNPRDCGGIAIEYRAEGFDEPTSGQLFFRTEAAPGFSEEKSISLPSLRQDNDWHTIEVDCAQVRGGKELWTEGGRITAIRLDLVDQFPGRIWLRTIRGLPPQLSRAEQLGLPTKRPVELPETHPGAASTAVDRDAPVFASPMTAPADGGFEHIGHCYLRRKFDLGAPIREALLQSVCDDEIAVVYLNGHRLENAWSRNWRQSDAVAVPPEYFVVGKNLLAVEYENTGSVGGLTMDLQVVGEDNSFALVTMAGACGALHADADWMQPGKMTDWPLAATRPGPPNPPWTDYPPYRSIEPRSEVFRVSLLERAGVELTVRLQGEPALERESRVFARLASKGVDKPILLLTGTLDDLEAVEQEDGSWLLHLDDHGYLRYGEPIEASWEIGMHDRKCIGDTTVSFQLGDRPMPGEKAVLRLVQTPDGPVAHLNGKPFYFNVLTVDSFQIATGMEGKDSPFNVIVSRAGGQHPQWWTGPGQYDFTALDRQLNFALANYPDAMLGFYIWCQPGLWYAKAYPERMSRDQNGDTRGYYVSTISFSNPEYREDTKQALAAFVEHCEKYFGPRMVFYNLMGGATCEWQGWTSHTELFSDYSQTETAQFTKFAAAQGLSISEVPSPAERLTHHSESTIFRNPITSWKSILYDVFYNYTMANCVNDFAKVVKKSCGGDKLVGAYYGYLQEYATLGYCVNAGGHNDLKLLLDSPDVDFFLSPNSYGLRALGGPNAEMKPFAAIREAGKLSMLEDDTRTCLIPATAHDQALNLEDTIAVFQRNLGMYLTQGVPLNQLPLVGGNELDHPAIRQIFRRAVQVGQFRYEHPAPKRAQIAAVVDEDSIRYLTPTTQSVACQDDRRFTYSAKGSFVESTRYTLPVSGELLYYQRFPVAQCGANVDWLLLSDVPRLASQYKLLIFLGAYADTPLLRQAIAAAREAGVTVLVAYGAGFIDPAGEEFSAAPVTEMLGMKIEKAEPGPIALEFLDGRTVGAEYTTSPRFAVNDPKAETLATYQSHSGLPAVARKGKSIFYGGALLDASFLRETARTAGVHIFCESDDNLYAGNGLVSLHAIRSGEKTLRFLEPTDIVDVFSGEVLGRRVSSVTIPMNSFQTRVLLTGEVDEFLQAIDLDK